LGAFIYDSNSFRASRKIVSPSIQRAGNVNIAAEFRPARYEDLAERFKSSRIYARVFRSGHHRADSISGLVAMSTGVEKFIAGNQDDVATQITVLLRRTPVRGPDLTSIFP